MFLGLRSTVWGWSDSMTNKGFALQTIDLSLLSVTIYGSLSIARSDP